MILQSDTLLAILLGAVYGALFGAIPGLTATLAIALFVPIAFFLEPAVALSAIAAMASVAIFAGDVASVVARMPGTPASAAYVEEIREVSRSRGAAFALGLSAWGSAIGGAIGVILLLWGAQALAALASRFSSFEFFWIALLGLVAGLLASAHFLKGLVALLLGMLLATVGIDSTLGFPRFTFGNPNLLGGLNYIVVMIGVFGFAEILHHLFLSAQTRARGETSEPRAIWKSFFIDSPLTLWKERNLALPSALIGTFVGFLPGAGADLAAWVSTSLQKIRGAVSPTKVVLAASCSNNSAVAGAWIPALALGIPGDTITAILLGLFLVKGITPGPLFFQDREVVQNLFLAFFLSCLVFVPLVGFVLAALASGLAHLPTRYLLGSIAGLCVAGAYAINNSLFDVWIMLGSGVLGFLLRIAGFPLAQLVLGMVLGPIVEQNFMVSAIKSHWDLGAFLQRPLAIAFMCLTIGLVFVSLWFRHRQAFREVNNGHSD
mgnify:CR=1 FL=1